MINLKSRSLIDYYSNNPDDYTIKYHHYNIVVNNDSKDEFENIEEDINSLRKINQYNSIYLKKKYNIVSILLGQIQYITNEYAYLLDILSNQFGIEKSNQLELEKNNNVTNDIYDISTYIKIYNCINFILIDVWNML